jgi:hypothetical protein
VNHEVQPAEPAVNAKPKRYWYQFSLKTLLVALTLLCIGPGGYVALEQNKARKQMTAFRTVNQYGGYFGSRLATSDRSQAERIILGDDTAANLTHVLFVRSDSDGRVFTFTDDCLQHLSSMPRIEEVDLTGIEVSDAGLVHLARLKNLNTVLLKNTKVTDEGVARLHKELPGCRVVR